MYEREGEGKVCLRERAGEKERMGKREEKLCESEVEGKVCV